MTNPPLPPLAEFLRWLAETPPAFRDDPPVEAVLNDLFETLGHAADADILAVGQPGKGKPAADRNRRLWVLAASWLLWHPALRTPPPPLDGLRRLFLEVVPRVAAVVPADGLLTDEDRREELVRLTLRSLGLSLPGESDREAEDRFTQVDSVEGRRVVRAAAERERRAREVREAMARRAAEEAASRYSPE